MSKSNKNLVDYVSWRSSSSRISEQDIQSSLEDGKVFMLESADTSGGPCVIVVARQHNKHTTPLDETIKLLTFTLDKAVDRMEDAGVTKGTLILDLAGATSKSLDVTALKSLVMFFSIYFPERIRTAVFYKPPSIFGYIWKLISPFMVSVQNKNESAQPLMHWDLSHQWTSCTDPDTKVALSLVRAHRCDDERWHSNSSRIGCVR